jgi:hypothetical protein
MERWEQAQIDRLEKRVAQLERKNWERSTRAFQLTMYGFTAAFVVLAIVAVAVGATHPAH